MPGLTVDTEIPSPSQQASHQQSPLSNGRSRSPSPVHPPYSPITPTLASARLSHSSLSPSAPPRIYTHAQPPQSFIPYPQAPAETISLDDNPDAIAVKSAISILQIQRQKAVADIQTLQKIKERALASPAAFAEAISTGELKTESKRGALFGISQDDDDDESDDDVDDGADMDVDGEPLDSDHRAPETRKRKWPELPRPQDVVRTPPVNWAQYGVVGESLDKLHADQVARPVDGLPAKIGADGQITPVDGGVRRTEPVSIAAPYAPGKDKIEKVAKKGGKK